MGRFWKVLTVIVGMIGCVIGVTVLFAMLGAGTGYFFLILLLVVVAAYVWMLFAFLHYRQCRQEELVGVLIAAAEAKAPLAQALWAYLRDRPHGGLRELWLALLLNFVVPGYYWIWYRRSNYDHKVDYVAFLLEAGHSLHEALYMTPRVASPATRLAALLGEQTGQLALCLQVLHSPARSRLTTVWLELMPRLAYPLCLLLVIGGILQFWATFLVPKFQRIFQDMRMTLPEETERAIALGDLSVEWAWVLGMAIPGFALVVTLLLISPAFRWYFPVVGRFYRAYVRSQILQALSFLLKVEKPAPLALALLADSGAFPGGARRRVQAVRRWVDQGEPLAESLYRGRILPRAMVPLLGTAARAGNLPWALAELADLLAQRTARRVQRLGLVLFPLPIVALGVLVGVIAFGFYVPLIALIEGLTQ